MQQPNIVYIHSHDTGRYIQPYGYAVPTPHLQKLAEEGVLFRQNFCVNPTCSPSRACLLAGNYPHQNGMIGLAHRGFTMHNYGQHLVHTLRKAGYLSVLAGFQHIASHTDEHQAWEIIGYDHYLGGPDQAHLKAAEFLTNPPQQPFFLSIGFTETHREFPAPHDCPDDPRYCQPPSPLPDTPETRLDMARFKASARILDRKMGMVFEALDTNGLTENTLVICTTDHGIAFPRMKCNLYDAGTGVMLIIRGPGGFDGGAVVDAMTSHLDIFPTLCELLEIALPGWLQGTSLLPLLRGDRAQIHDAIFTTLNYHAAYEPMRAVRTTRWKYIRRFDGRTRPVLPNCDDGESKTVWLNHGWKEREPEPEMLYDLVFDPNEAYNLAHDSSYSEVLADMRQRLEEWMHTTDDPLVHGHVTAPQRAQVNDVNGISPREPVQSVSVG